jgi:hypothetical protein
MRQPCTNIPDYFPTEVGVVGGMTGLLGGGRILLPHHLQLPANLHGRMVKLMDICTTPFGPLFSMDAYHNH